MKILKKYNKGGVTEKKYLVVNGEKHEIPMGQMLVGRRNAEYKKGFIEKHGPGPYTIITEKHSRDGKKVKSKTHKLFWHAGVSEAPSWYGGMTDEKKKQKHIKEEAYLGYGEKQATRKVKDVKRRGKEMVKIVERKRDDKGRMRRTKKFVPINSMDAYAQDGDIIQDRGDTVFSQKMKIKQLKSEDRAKRALKRKENRRAARLGFKNIVKGVERAGVNVGTEDEPRTGRYGQRRLFGAGRIKRLKEVIARNRAIKKEVKGEDYKAASGKKLTRTTYTKDKPRFWKGTKQKQKIVERMPSGRTYVQKTKTGKEDKSKMLKRRSPRAFMERLAMKLRKRGSKVVKPSFDYRA